MARGKMYNVKFIDSMYNKLPAFTEVFDEETFYTFVMCFVAATFVTVFIISRFVTLRPANW